MSGRELSNEQFVMDLKKNRGWITCVLFMGGEWHQKELMDYLDITLEAGLKTALYTGSEEVSSDLLGRLNYLKTGPYKKELGGLDSLTTNQILKNTKTGEILNSRFILSKEVTYDSTQ